MRWQRNLGWLCCGILCLSAARAGAEPIDPARLAPESAVFYAELTNLDPLLDAALDAKTREFIQNADAYKRYRESSQYPQMTAGVALLEVKLGTNWHTALRDLFGGGMAVCGDPANQSGFLALRCRKPELLKKLNAALIEFIEADAKNKGRPSPVQVEEHQGVTGWSFGPNECHIILDDLLVISNKTETLKAVIDRQRDAAAKGLTSSSSFTQARAKKPAGVLGWSWADLTAIRKDPNVQKALSAKSDNPPAELLLGGVGDAVRQAPYVTSTLSQENNRLRLRTELPFDASQRSASRQWFFVPTGNEPGLRPQGTIASFSLFRDLGGLWSARETLFNETIVAQFAQADTQFGLFFSGRDFGPEVLGELAAPLQLVVAQQEYPADQPTPQLKLPAMALVLKLKHPDEFAPQLLIAYQKIIGITNIDGGQKGRPQLLLSTEDYHGAAISKATYLPDAKVSRDKAPVNYNFSPSCARRDEHFVLGSTVGIVKQLVDALKNGPAAPLTDNTALTVDAAPLAAILADNRELLITQNMLSDGHTRDEAETAIGTLLALINRFDRFALRLIDDASTLSLEAALDIRPARP